MKLVHNGEPKERRVSNIRRRTFWGQLCFKMAALTSKYAFPISKFTNSHAIMTYFPILISVLRIFIFTIYFFFSKNDDDNITVRTCRLSSWAECFLLKNIFRIEIHNKWKIYQISFMNFNSCIFYSIRKKYDFYVNFAKENSPDLIVQIVLNLWNTVRSKWGVLSQKRMFF